MCYDVEELLVRQRLQTRNWKTVIEHSVIENWSVIRIHVANFNLVIITITSPPPPPSLQLVRLNQVPQDLKASKRDAILKK